MEEIIKLFNDEKPRFDGQPLILKDIELINSKLPYNNIGNEKLLFHGTPLENLDSNSESWF